MAALLWAWLKISSAMDDIILLKALTIDKITLFFRETKRSCLSLKNIVLKPERISWQ